MSGKLLLIYICNFHVLSNLLLIYICKFHWNKAGDRDVLKDSNVDVLICLDELKIILQARNSICHGLSTLVELLFLSFGTVERKEDRWFEEYLGGAGVELVNSF